MEKLKDIRLSLFIPLTWKGDKDQFKRDFVIALREIADLVEKSIGVQE